MSFSLLGDMGTCALLISEWGLQVGVPNSGGDLCGYER